MSNANLTVNLTARQQEFFNYAMDYHKKNGALPTVSQAARDLNMHSPGALNVYGALFLKGVFTAGKALVSGSGSGNLATKSVNVMDLKIDPKPYLRKPYTRKAVAEAIQRVLGDSSPEAKKLAAALGL